jgi:hypothetical protein
MLEDVDYRQRTKKMSEMRKYRDRQNDREDVGGIMKKAIEDIRRQLLLNYLITQDPNIIFLLMRL